MANQHFLAACESDGFEAVMAGVERYRRSKRVCDGYVMGMERWLERKCWIQEPAPADQTTGDVAAIQEHLARIDAERAGRGR